VSCIRRASLVVKECLSPISILPGMLCSACSTPTLAHILTKPQFRLMPSNISKQPIPLTAPLRTIKTVWILLSTCLANIRAFCSGKEVSLLCFAFVPSTLCSLLLWFCSLCSGYICAMFSLTLVPLCYADVMFSHHLFVLSPSFPCPRNHLLALLVLLPWLLCL
jgi:hypothetical protein